MLGRLAGIEPIARWSIAGHAFEITPIKLVLGALIAAFALLEVSKRAAALSFGRRWIPFGGALSGFFGGLSGHQGALRSAFLIRAGLDKQAFIATGVVVATVVDVTRLAVYSERFLAANLAPHGRLLASAALAAFAGAWAGNRALKKVSLRSIEVGVAVLLGLVALGLGSGLL